MLPKCSFFSKHEIDVYPEEEYPSATIIEFTNNTDQPITVSGGNFGYSDSDSGNRIELRAPAQLTVLPPHESGTFVHFHTFNDELFEAEIVANYLTLSCTGFTYTIAGWPKSVYSWPEESRYEAGYLAGDNASRDFKFSQDNSKQSVDMHLGEKESRCIRVYATLTINSDKTITYRVDRVKGSGSAKEEGIVLWIEAL
ncbi:MAG TPA: hypothetical protein PK408_05915 [Treponemataceae bacterium]|nr:hypothetical protein [Treponemataceae bacterium]